LRNKSDYFTVIDDVHAAGAMRVLGAPLDGDSRVVSGESGASGMGFLFELLSNDELADLRSDAGVGKDSHFLLFSTEGDTDPESYREIVWNGKFGAR